MTHREPPPGLSLGVPRLDAQHEQLQQLVLQLQTALDGGRPAQELRRLAALLTLHARMHFMDEEMFMEGAEYPGLARHRLRHSEFTEGLLRLQAGLRSDRSKSLSAIVEYELSWIARHLEEEDAELGHWLRKSETALNCAVESLSSSIPKTADACTEI